MNRLAKLPILRVLSKGNGTRNMSFNNKLILRVIIFIHYYDIQPPKAPKSSLLAKVHPDQSVKVHRPYGGGFFRHNFAQS